MTDTKPAKKKRRLSLKQSKFIAVLPTAKSLTQAAIDAGYSERSARQIGSDNMTKTDIASAIAPLYDENKVKQVISKWLDCETGTHALKAAELAARTLAMLTDRQKVETKLESAIDTSKLTDDQLRDELLKRLKLSSQGLVSQYTEAQASDRGEHATT